MKIRIPVLNEINPYTPIYSDDEYPYVSLDHAPSQRVLVTVVALEMKVVNIIQKQSPLPP